MKKILAILMLLCVVLNASAQVPQHDEDKENIIKSMESGHWNFSPDWYMYFFHKDYSGAGTEWRNRFLKSGWAVTFKESKSNVKSIMPRRLVSLAGQKAKEKIVEEERIQIAKLYAEEMARFADRNFDLVYKKYTLYFSELEESIEECLTYCMSVSKGKLASKIQELEDCENIIKKNIAYLHRMGLRNELENQKRDQGYRDAKKDLEILSRQAYALARVAHAYYD